MKKYLLDTSALMAALLDEPGADKVAQVLLQARDLDAQVLVCFMSEVEVAYRVWRMSGQSASEDAVRSLHALNVTWVQDSPALRRATIAIKAMHALSLADAWIAAAAQTAGATLVHKDPEFLALDLPQEVLELKAPNR